MSDAGLSTSPPRLQPGLFVVLEGGDGTGRSTQIRLLLPWLEESGWAATRVGLGRSTLLRRAFRSYRRTPEAGPQTLALLYAADLRAQVEGSVRSDLASGFVVIADRWIGAARARCQVRGVDPGWLETILPEAPLPDITFYLDADPRQRLAREIGKRGMPDFRESGRDLGLDADPLRAFVRYQALLDRQYARIAAGADAHWIRLDAGAPPEQVQHEIRQGLLRLLRAPDREAARDE